MKAKYYIVLVLSTAFCVLGTLQLVKAYQVRNPIIHVTLGTCT